MLRTTLAAAAITLAAGAASAITVDNFLTTNSTGAIIGTGPTSGGFTDSAGIGTSRTVTATINSALMGLNAEIKADSNENNTGRFNFEADSLANAEVSLAYTGLGGVDLAANVLQLVAVANDSAFNLNVSITSGGSTDDADFSIGAFNTMDTLSFDLSGISGATSADEVVFTFLADEHGGDISFGEISQVPVPAAGLLLVGALGGMAALRRRKAA